VYYLLVYLLNKIEINLFFTLLKLNFNQMRSEDITAIILICMFIFVVVFTISMYNCLKNVDVTYNRRVIPENVVRRRLLRELLISIHYEIRQEEIRRNMEAREQINRQLQNTVIVINPLNHITIGTC